VGEKNGEISKGGSKKKWSASRRENGACDWHSVTQKQQHSVQTRPQKQQQRQQQQQQQQQKQQQQQ
jgi:hypothetical protein